MKLQSILLGLALLASSLPAFGQIRNVTDNAAGISYNANSKAVLGTYTAGKEDHTLLANAAAGAFTITLPAPSSRANPYLVIKKTDSTSNAVTLDPFGAATIDGASTVSISSQYQMVILHASALGWHVLGSNGIPRVITTATTTTLTADQLYNSTFINTGASGAIVLTLPAPKTGMRFRVYLNVAQDVDIDAAADTQILALTNATGDAISSAATIGNCIELVALSATTWGAFASSGTWSDVN